MIRALEVYLLTGRSITEKEEAEETLEHVLVCLQTDRETLYKRIDSRVDEMFGRGLVDEVKRLLEEGVTFDMQSMQAIGYKEFKPYFTGGATLEAVAEIIKLNSRHYAKRQETWFRSMPSAQWITNGKNIDLINEMKQIIIKKGVKWN